MGNPPARSKLSRKKTVAYAEAKGDKPKADAPADPPIIGAEENAAISDVIGNASIEPDPAKAAIEEAELEKQEQAEAKPEPKPAEAPPQAAAPPEPPKPEPPKQAAAGGGDEGEGGRIDEAGPAGVGSRAEGKGGRIDEAGPAGVGSRAEGEGGRIDEAGPAGVDEPALMPVAKEVPTDGSPDDPAPAPGTTPPGDSRSFRRGNDFALIYRIGTFLISRVGTVGRRGTWRVVEYPTTSSASHGYAKESSRFVSEGFSDYRG
jgi:hypothetical protein